MAAQQEVIIVIAAEDAASKIFQKVGKSAKAEGDKIKKSFKESLGEVGKSATDLGKKMSIGLTAPLAAFGAVALDTAMSADRLTRTLEGLAGGADEAASYIDAIKTASQGTLSQVQALEVANRALSFGVVKNADEMAHLTEVAIALGRAQGLDAATAVSDLTTALSRNSPMILDNLGITLKLTEAYDIYADKIGKSADALTAEEKAIAFREAALIKGMETVEQMGGVQDDLAGSAEQLKAQMSDMALTVGQSLVPMLQSGIDVVKPILQSFMDLDPATQKLIVAMGLLAAAAGPAMAAFGSFATLISKMPTSMSGLNTALHGTNASLLAVGAAVGAAVIAWQKYNQLQDELDAGVQRTNEALGAWSDYAAEAVANGDDMATVMGELGSRAEGASDALHKDGNAIEDLSAAFVRASRGAEVYTSIQERANKVAVERAGTYEDYIANIEAYNASVDDQALKVLSMSEAQAAAQEVMASSNVHMTEQAALAQVMNDNIVMLTQSEYEFAQSADEAMLSVMEFGNEFLGIGQDAEQGAEQATQAIDATAAAAQIGMISISGYGEAAEMAAMNQERQEEAARKQAEAMALAKEQAIQSAQAFLDMSSSLKDATDAQIAQTLIGQLDPEALGAEDYTTAVQDIQLAFGLADEKSIALAENIGSLTDAINNGLVAPDQAAEALQRMAEAAGEGNTNASNLLGEFERAPGLITPTEERIQGMEDKMRALAEEGIPPATEGIGAFQGAVETAYVPVSELSDKAEILKGKLDKLDGTYTITVVVEQEGQVPEFQSGGVVPGPLGQPMLAVVHGGERVIPVGGTTNNANYEGNQYNVTINDTMAAAMFMEQARQQELARFDARM